MSMVETALGPVPTTELGPTLMHEHVITRSPGVQENWPHLWDRNAILDIAERKMADLYRRGIRAIVDLTTVDLGRDIDLIVGVARRSRVHIVVATGVWWMPRWPSCSCATSPRASGIAASRRPSSSAPPTPRA
jgi:phosphotriesterase-related protein